MTTTGKLRVMLGSSSKWRRGLVAQTLPDGFEMASEHKSPDIDEKAIRRDDPQELVLAIAQGKTDKLLEEVTVADCDLLICADQVIVFNGVVREKPEDEKQAKEHLQSYGAQNVPAVCTTGLVVTALATKKRYSGVDVAVQHFKPIPDDVADALIKKGDIMYCAGSFVVEDELMQPFLGERQGEIESVQGMPVKLTQTLLQQAAQDLIQIEK